MAGIAAAGGGMTDPRIVGTTYVIVGVILIATNAYRLGYYNGKESLGHEVTELKNAVRALERANKNGLDSCG